MENRRLIDLDKIKPIDFPSTEMDGLDVVRYLNTLTTVDAVEVVRCKDCKRRIEKRWCYSLHTYNGEPVGVADDFFCAYGKRKSDG